MEIVNILKVFKLNKVNIKTEKGFVILIYSNTNGFCKI